MTTGRIMAALLVRGTDDWSFMAEVVSVLLAVEGEPVRPALRERSLDVVSRLLSSGLMEAGEFDGKIFVSWNLGVEESLARITREWDRLDTADGLPSVGDVCWLANTSDGDEIGERLLAEDYRGE